MSDQDSYNLGLEHGFHLAREEYNHKLEALNATHSETIAHSRALYDQVAEQVVRLKQIIFAQTATRDEAKPMQ
jgi:hypothetical protein